MKNKGLHHQIESGTVTASRNVLELAEKTYSADKIAQGKISGIFEYGGKQWVCVSVWAKGEVILSAKCVEVLPNSGPALTSEWVLRKMGPIVKYAQACKEVDAGTRQRDQLYAGIAVTFNGQEYVLGYRHLCLEPEENLEPKQGVGIPTSEPSLPIPGLEETSAEVRESEAKIEGERLSLFVKHPPLKEISTDKLLAGPLFRAASPQKGLFSDD